MNSFFREVIGVSSIEECLRMTGCFIGMILSTQIAHYAFGQRPIGQYLIEQLFNVVTLLAAAAFIGYFG